MRTSWGLIVLLIIVGAGVYLGALPAVRLPVPPSTSPDSGIAIDGRQGEASLLEADADAEVTVWTSTAGDEGQLGVRTWVIRGTDIAMIRASAGEQPDVADSYTVTLTASRVTGFGRWAILEAYVHRATFSLEQEGDPLLQPSRSHRHVVYKPGPGLFGFKPKPRPNPSSWRPGPGRYRVEIEVSRTLPTVEEAVYLGTYRLTVPQG